MLVGHLPATRPWERADQDLLELFASEIAVAIRNAQLFAQVEAQNTQLLELDAAKDDFLRGVSHNLQTPLTSIRAYADQLEPRPAGPAARDHRRADRPPVADGPPAADRDPPRVRGAPAAERGRRARASGSGGRGRRSRPSDVDVRASTTESAGWLAVADVDQLDQVLWALLDNAVKYGERSPVARRDRRRSRRRAGSGSRSPTSGPGVAEADRARLFGRFERGAERTADDGSGLGLYVSRELCRAMGGDLVLEPAARGRGAAFSVYLPGEPPDES